jgi:hypothetical protein
MNRVLPYVVLVTTLLASANLNAQDQPIVLKKHYNISSIDVKEDFTLFETRTNPTSAFIL